MRAILLVAVAITLPPFSGFKVEGVTEYEKVTIVQTPASVTLRFIDSAITLPFQLLMAWTLNWPKKRIW